MITLLSTPEHITQVSPEIVSRWLATESPNNFRLQRKDFLVTGESDNGGFLELTLSSDFTGFLDDVIAVYDATNDAMIVGTVTGLYSPATTVLTDIPYVAGMDIEYMNDNSLRGGYYFEGRLTINDVVQTLTVIASPDSFGIADLDVSGILRIMTVLQKTGDYTDLLMAETGKSGKFTFEYRECWYGSDESYTAEGNDWFYVEAVRSEEQGSNLYDYVPTEADDAPFFNSFDQPVFFVGLPFDLSFVLPVLPVTSPETELTVTIKRYNATNTLLGTTATNVSLGDLEGYINSVNIDPAAIEDAAAYLTVEITSS